MGWDLAFRAAELGLAQGSLIDLAYRIRENDHPEYGGLEVEIAGIEPAGACMNAARPTRVGLADSLVKLRLRVR